jgi:hypothetical protein
MHADCTHYPAEPAHICCISCRLSCWCWGALSIDTRYLASGALTCCSGCTGAGVWGRCAAALGVIHGRHLRRRGHRPHDPGAGVSNGFVERFCVSTGCKLCCALLLSCCRPCGLLPCAPVACSSSRLLVCSGWVKQLLVSQTAVKVVRSGALQADSPFVWLLCRRQTPTGSCASRCASCWATWTASTRRPTRSRTTSCQPQTGQQAPLIVKHATALQQSGAECCSALGTRWRTTSWMKQSWPAAVLSNTS